MMFRLNKPPLSIFRRVNWTWRFERYYRRFPTLVTHLKSPLDSRKQQLLQPHPLLAKAVRYLEEGRTDQKKEEIAKSLPEMLVLLDQALKEYHEAQKNDRLIEAKVLLTAYKETIKGEKRDEDVFIKFKNEFSGKADSYKKLEEDLTKRTDNALMCIYSILNVLRDTSKLDNDQTSSEVGLVKDSEAKVIPKLPSLKDIAAKFTCLKSCTNFETKDGFKAHYTALEQYLDDMIKQLKTALKENLPPPDNDLKLNLISLTSSLLKAESNRRERDLEIVGQLSEMFAEIAFNSLSFIWGFNYYPCLESFR